MLKKLFVLSLLLLAGSAYAGDASVWKDFTFPRYKPIEFKVSGEQIDINSKAASSMLYRAISVEEQKKPRIKWAWLVESSDVKATPLDIAHGDDRTIGVYIFFSKTPVVGEASLSTAGNYIAYIWGSSHKVGEVITSPDKQGRMIIVRAYKEKKQKWFSETMDYKKDFEKAFAYKGYPSFVAISADTDDSNATTIAAVKNIVFSDAP
ncbi:MAG: DUF3047 domain-containing protein [Rickettsiales bacterium]